jgi:hypothetical protein
MPYRIDIYVGGDNDSLRIDRHYMDKVRKWANSNFAKEYILIKVQGRYNGMFEDSILINIIADYDLALKDQSVSLKQRTEARDVAHRKITSRVRACLTRISELAAMRMPVSFLPPEFLQVGFFYYAKPNLQPFQFQLMKKLKNISGSTTRDRSRVVEIETISVNHTL